MVKSFAAKFPILLTLALSLIALSGCQPGAPAELSPADREMVAGLMNAYLDGARKGDWAAVAALYAEDAIVFPPNSPAVSGRADIEAHMKAWPPITEFIGQDVEVMGSGDRVIVRGTYSMTFALPGGAVMSDKGKYMDIRVKQPDGSWRFKWDMYNSDMPMPGMGDAPPPAMN